MKKILSIAAVAGMMYFANAQVIITDGNAASPGYETVSVLLGFGDGFNKGIILPEVESVDAQNQGGTFVYNTVDQSVQVWEGRNGGGWFELTPNGEGTDHPYINAGEDVGAGAIMGSDTTDKDGVLVLESSDKALVLPRIGSPHLKIKSPVAGTMVYDTDTDMLAVFNGETWHFWK